MPYCPSCRGEFREGFEWCERCEVALVPELEPDFTDPDEMARRLAGQEVVPLLVGPLLDLKALRDELAAARIACVIGPPPDAEDCSTGSCTPRLALYVAVEDVAAARKRLGLDEGPESGADAGAGERCPACSAPLRRSAESCEECGLFLGG